MRPLSPLLAGLLLTASLLAPSAQAQSKKELVAKILALQKPQYEQFGQMMAQGSIQPMLQGAGMALQQRVAADKREAVGKAMDAEVQAFLKDVTPALRASALKNAPEAIGAKLDASFNEVELKQIIGYLESPVMKRYIQLGPELQQALAAKMRADNQPLIETKARALNAKLVELLGLPAQGSSAPATAPK